MAAVAKLPVFRRCFKDYTIKVFKEWTIVLVLFLLMLLRGTKMIRNLLLAAVVAFTILSMGVPMLDRVELPAGNIFNTNSQVASTIQ